MNPWEEASNTSVVTPPWEEAASPVPAQDNTKTGTITPEIWSTMSKKMAQDEQWRKAASDMNDPGTGLTTAFAQFARSMLPTPARPLTALEQQAGVEEVPKLTQFLAGGQSALEKLPLQLANLLDTPSVAIPSALGVGDNVLTQTALENIKLRQAAIDRISRDDQDMYRGGPMAQLGEALTKGAAELPLYIGPGMLAKTEAGAMNIASGVAGTMSGGQQYSQDVGTGMDPVQALPHAIAQGMIDALVTKAFGATGKESILAKDKPALPLSPWEKAKDVLHHGKMEGAEEMTAQALQDVDSRVERDNSKPLADSIKDIGFAGLVGSLLGGGVTAGGAAVNTFGDRIQENNFNAEVDAMIKRQAQNEALSATFPEKAPVVPGRSFGGTQPNLGGEQNGQEQKVENGQGKEVLTPVEPPVATKPPVVLEPEHESIAKGLGLKPESADFGVPGMPKMWGFSPVDNLEIGTFYTKAGATAEEVQTAWEAKKAAFEAAKPKVETAVVEPPKPVENKEETLNVQHELKNVAVLLKHPGLDASLRSGFQATGDSIFNDYQKDFDHVKAKERIAALKKEMEEATTKVAAVKPEWVRTIESLAKQGVAPPQSLARLQKWHTENGTTMPNYPKPPLRQTPKHLTHNYDPRSREETAKALGLEDGKATVVTGLEKMAADEGTHGAGAALAKFLLDHFKPVIAVTKNNFGNSGGKYSYRQHKILGLTTHAGNDVPGLLLHEASHAAIWYQLEFSKDPEVVKARAELEKLMELSAKTETSVTKTKLGDSQARHHFEYAHNNVHEFVAGLFDNQAFRDHLNEIKVGDGTALSKAIDWLMQVLGIERGSALAAAFDAVARGSKGLSNDTSLKTFNQLRVDSGIGVKPVAVPKTASKSKTEFNDNVGDDENGPGDNPWTGSGPDPLPFRYKDYNEEKTDATTAHGIGKMPGLARLFDPRAYKITPEERVILTNGISKQKADAGVATWLEQKKSMERAFKLDENGEFTFADGSKGYMSDAIEAEIANPGSQPLTAEQKAFIAEWKAINEEGIRYAAENGVKFFLDEDGNATRIDDPHFPRPRIGTVGEEAHAQSMAEGAKPGAKQGPFKARYHETEAEGHAKNVKYESDEYNRVADWLRAVYRSVADTKLAEDPALKGRLGMRLVPSGIFDKNGFMTYSMVGHGPGYGEGEVFGVPALKGRVFSKATADKLSAFYQNNIPNALRHVIDVNNRLKAVKFTMDVSAPFNQGLAMMATNPVRWAKATALSYKTWMNPNTLSEYLNVPENAAAAREYVENGGSLVRLQDFLSGAESEKGVTKIKPIDAVIHTSARSMGTFLSIAKIEMYKALKPTLKPGEKLSDLVESVDNKIFSGRMEQIGLTQGRALIERVLINAPSYLRAFANLAVDGAKGAAKPLVGKQANIAERTSRNAIAGMMVSVGAMMFAAYKAQGLSDDEIKERFDPRSSKFFRISIPMGNGKSVEMGYGNVILSFTRLLGDTVEIVQGTKPLRPGIEGNPWIRWLSYRKSPVVDAIWQGFTGKDFQGNDVGPLEVAGRSIVPIPVEPMATHLLKGEGSMKSASLETTAQFFGLNAFTKERPSLEEASREKYGKPVGQLSIRERFDLKQTLDALPKPSMKDKERSTIQATKNQFERQREVIADLPSATQTFIKTNGLEIPSFQSGFEVKGKNIPLSKEERAKHQEIVTEEYKKSLDALMASPRIEEFVKDGSLQKRVNIILNNANARARLRLKREVRSATP